MAQAAGVRLMYLLDTNVVSELRKTRPHAGVLAWLSDVPEDSILISVVTLGELQAGVERTRRQDPVKAAEIEAWLDGVSDREGILPMDGRVFREWARLMAGSPLQLAQDAMIAATARVHRLTVVTRNVRDFRSFDVPALDPFAPAK
jgi:predicted nucleic acid-binding protein